MEGICSLQTPLEHLCGAWNAGGEEDAGHQLGAAVEGGGDGGWTGQAEGRQ